MNKTLTACFSATGNTEAVAKIVAETAKSDFSRIVPEQPYSAEDLDWNNSQSRSTLEMKDASCRPAIADRVENMGEYKTIYLGFPIWWYEAPRIIATFLESYDFAGKAIIPFVTSGSSGLGRTPEILEKLCPAAHWLPGIRFPQHPAAEAVRDWAKEHSEWKQQ